MKILDLRESSPFDNEPFANKAAEIVALENKRKANEYQRQLIIDRLNKTGLSINGSKFSSYNVTHYTIDHYPPSTQKLCKMYRTFITKYEAISERLKDLKIRGHSFCFTGFRDTTLERKIERQGGKVVSSVSNTTTYLVRGNKDKVSGKMLKAQQTGTKVITREQLVDFLRD